MSAIPALTLAEVTEQAIDPALKLLPSRMDSPEARVQILAIGLQESGFLYRRQIDSQGHPTGPAKSFWMGEKGGGMVRGVRRHPATRDFATALYAVRGVRRLDFSIWNAIEHDDVLAAGLARLLLFTDPYKLPTLGHSESAWELYYRTWKPGRPRRATWDAYYRRAVDFVTEGEE